MTAPRYTRLSEDEYLLRLRQEIDALKATSEASRYVDAEKEQTKVVAHFLDRAIQFGEATYRIRNLPIVLRVLLRVFCDDLIRLFWVAQSENNASEYVKIPVSELAKMGRVNLEKGHARLINKKTGEDETAKLLPELARWSSKAKSVEQLAKECALEKVYDIPFRFSSLAVHGNTFLPQLPADADLVVLPAIIAFLRATSTIAENYPVRTTSAEEILHVLRLDKVGRN
jgi:hypothetical protein